MGAIMGHSTAGHLAANFGIDEIAQLAECSPPISDIPAELSQPFFKVTRTAPESALQIMPGPIPVTQSTTTLLSLSALSAVMLMVFLAAICAICKRKHRKKSVLPDGMVLMDVSLLRQTQLRSLSKSDTKLHELKSPRFNKINTRPLSMDYRYASTSDRGGQQKGHSERIPPNRVLPNIPYAHLRDDSRTLDHIYSTLKIESEFRPPGCLMGTSESGIARGELKCQLPPTATRSEDTATVVAEYACVKKLKDTPTQVCNQAEFGNVKVSSGDISILIDTQTGPPKASALNLEEMYSTVCKQGKKEYNYHTQSAQKSPTPERLPHTPRAEIQTWCPPNTAEQDRDTATVNPTAVLELEPAYETIDKHWTRRRVQMTIDVLWSSVGGKGKTGARNATENLYESISEAKEPLPIEGTGMQKTNNGFEAYLTGL